MYRHQCFREHFPGRFRAGCHHFIDIHPDGFSAHGTIGFISNLNHSDIHTGILQLLQAVQSVLIQGFHLGVNLHLRPGKRTVLLRRVCPEIRVMEVDKQLHMVLCCTFTNLDCILNIAVSTSKTVTLCIKGIVPDSDANVVDSVIIQGFIYIGFFSVKIIVFYATVFQGRNTGCIHTEDKVFRQVFDRFHIQGV